MKLLEACFCFFVAVVEANHRGGSTVRSNKITQANMDALPTLHCCEAQNCELCDISNGHNADIFDCFGQYHYASMRVRYTLGGDFAYFGSCFNAIEEFPVSCCLTSDCQDNTCGTIKDPNLFNCQLDDFGVEFCDYNAIDYPSNVNGNHCAEDGFPAYRRNQDGLCTSTGLPDWGRCCESRYGNTNDKDDKDDKQNYDNYYDEDSGEEEVEEEQYAHEDDRNLQQIYRCTDCLDVFDPLDWCIDSYTAFKDAVSFDLSDGDCLVDMTRAPSERPTNAPSISPRPSARPSEMPSRMPSSGPSISSSPTGAPSQAIVTGESGDDDSNPVEPAICFSVSNFLASVRTFFRPTDLP